MHNNFLYVCYITINTKSNDFLASWYLFNSKTLMVVSIIEADDREKIQINNHEKRGNC